MDMNQEEVESIIWMNKTINFFNNTVDKASTPKYYARLQHEIIRDFLSSPDMRETPRSLNNLAFALYRRVWTVTASKLSA